MRTLDICVIVTWINLYKVSLFWLSRNRIQSGYVNPRAGGGGRIDCYPSYDDSFSELGDGEQLVGLLLKRIAFTSTSRAWIRRNAWNSPATKGTQPPDHDVKHDQYKENKAQKK
eukprot:2592655-Pleurochrysis_carterae.AAC.2